MLFFLMFGGLEDLEGPPMLGGGFEHQTKGFKVSNVSTPFRKIAQF
jgi:hypothetical protein